MHVKGECTECDERATRSTDTQSHQLALQVKKWAVRRKQRKGNFPLPPGKRGAVALQSVGWCNVYLEKGKTKPNGC